MVFDNKNVVFVSVLKYYFLSTISTARGHGVFLGLVQNFAARGLALA